MYLSGSLQWAKILRRGGGGCSHWTTHVYARQLLKKNGGSLSTKKLLSRTLILQELQYRRHISQVEYCVRPCLHLEQAGFGLNGGGVYPSPPRRPTPRRLNPKNTDPKAKRKGERRKRQTTSAVNYVVCCGGRQPKEDNASTHPHTMKHWLPVPDAAQICRWCSGCKRMSSRSWERREGRGWEHMGKEEDR